MSKVNQIPLEVVSSKDQPDELKEDRQEWGKQIQFLLACIGYSVGLGNVW